MWSIFPDRLCCLLGYPSTCHLMLSRALYALRVWSPARPSAVAKNVWEQRRNLIIPRSRLRELLLDGVASHDEAAIEWGSSYIGHDQLARRGDDGRLVVELEQRLPSGAHAKRTVGCRVLVGADGVCL